jgi:hypothetical protein
MKKYFKLALVISGLSVQAQALTQHHLQGRTPVGPYLASLREQSATIEKIILAKAQEVCKDDDRFMFSDLKIITRSSGGTIDLNHNQDSNDTLNSAIAMGQPHTEFSVDVRCKD